MKDYYNWADVITARLEETLSPLCTIPLPRDPDFVDRELLLSQIHKKSSRPASRIALTGISGVGYDQPQCNFYC